jgi:NAD(P)-dependent dehydrogenase (short-subunit alcohol dehydrogenase family)
MKLTGKRIVLIGGSAGIGLATAKRAAKQGASVVIAGRTEQRLQSAKQQIDGTVETHQLDATDEAAVADFFAKIGPFDHLSMLVPAASDKALSTKFVRFLDMTSEDFAAVFTNRFWSQCYAARHGAPHMNPDGSIIFVSSTQPRKAISNYSASGAASGAIEILARILSIELSPIRVNVMAPGFIETPSTDDIPADRRAAWDQITSAQAVKRLGRAEEIADGMLFLMTSEYTTGTVLDIDGGYRLT